MTVVIYHNPSCGTSRKALALIRASGAEPVVIDYQKAGWTVPQLQGLFAAAGLSARQALRVKGKLAEELGLTDPGVGEDALLQAMAAHPVLVERPIVSAPKGVRLCRPLERVLEILDPVPDGGVVSG